MWACDAIREVGGQMIALVGFFGIVYAVSRIIEGRNKHG